MLSWSDYRRAIHNNQPYSSPQRIWGRARESKLTSNGPLWAVRAAASIGVLAIGLTTASAADLRPRPVYRAPPAAAAAVYFSWSSCYVGGHVGGVWTRKDWFVRDAAFASFGQSDGSHDADGVIGGVQGGCDYQFAGGFGAASVMGGIAS
jgi:hypothetical protein